MEEYQYKGEAPEKLCQDFSSWHYPGPPENLATWEFDLKQEIFLEQHPVTTRARRGDLIRVIRYVEDRHGLEVRDFQMTLLLKSPLATGEPSPTDELSPTEEHNKTKGQ